MPSFSDKINRPPFLPLTLKAGLLTGALDAFGAIVVYGLIMGRTTPVRIFQGIASALLGRAAFEGGWLTALLGLFLHFLIATLFCAVYILICRRWSFPLHHPLLSGVIYGIVVWGVMNFAVLPLSGMPVNYEWIPAVRGILILIACIGLPLSFFIRRQFTVIR